MPPIIAPTITPTSAATFRSYQRQIAIGASLAQRDEKGQPDHGPGGDEQDAAHTLLAAATGARAIGSRLSIVKGVFLRRKPNRTCLLYKRLTRWDGGVV